MTTTSTKIYRLPSRFYDDHLYRDCLSGMIVKRIGRSNVIVELDAEAYDDLLSDCEYYDDAEMWENYRGLVLSARATRRALIETGRPA